MEKQIKDLRTQIDGLAQLVKELKPQKIYKIDVAQIPDGWNIDKWIEYAKTEKVIVDTSKGSQNIPIQELSQNYKELEKATNSLYLAKAWLGKCLEELGTESPYKSGYKTKEDIEPTADTSKPCPITGNGHDDWNLISHIEKVDRIRTDIQELINEAQSRIYASIEWETKNSIYHLIEAKFWLGFELQRIKESKQ